MGGPTGATEVLPAAGLLLTLCAWLCKQLLLALTPLLLAEPQAVVGVVTEEPSVLARVGALDVMAVGAFLVLCRVRLRQDAPAAPVLQSSAAAGARGWTRRSAPSPPPTSAGVDASQVVYSPFRGLPKGSALPPPSTVADKLDDTVSVSERTPLPPATPFPGPLVAPRLPPWRSVRLATQQLAPAHATSTAPRSCCYVLTHRVGSADPRATVRSGLYPAAAARRDPAEPHNRAGQRGRHPVRAGGPRLCRLRHDQGWARGAACTRLRALPGRAL